MEATEYAVTPDTDADVAEDTTTLSQTEHTRKVYVQTMVTTSLIMATRQRLIKGKENTMVEVVPSRWYQVRPRHQQ